MGLIYSADDYIWLAEYFGMARATRGEKGGQKGVRFLSTFNSIGLWDFSVRTPW